MSEPMFTNQDEIVITYRGKQYNAVGVFFTRIASEIDGHLHYGNKSAVILKEPLKQIDTNLDCITEMLNHDCDKTNVKYLMTEMLSYPNGLRHEEVQEFCNRLIDAINRSERSLLDFSIESHRKQFHSMSERIKELEKENTELKCRVSASGAGASEDDAIKSLSGKIHNLRTCLNEALQHMLGKHDFKGDESVRWQKVLEDAQ